jgi:hypothetical protein
MSGALQKYRRNSLRKLLCVAALVSLAIGTAPAGAAPVITPTDTTIVFAPIPGYSISPEATVYDSGNLWMFIDGAAELFLTYGFEDLHVAYYRLADGAEIRAEVYRHDTPENAFGMYSQERSPDGSFIDIGVQGYSEEGMMNFLAGRYYVKVSTGNSGSAAEQAMLTVARNLSKTLAQPSTWPAALAMLPTRGRIPNSEQLISRDFLGYGFLHGAYVASYNEKSKFEVFVIPTSSRTEVEAMLASFAKANKLQVPDTNPCTIPDVNQGEVALVIRGNILGGVVHCKDASVRLHFLEILQTSLK